MEVTTVRKSCLEDLEQLIWVEKIGHELVRLMKEDSEAKYLILD